MAAKKTSKKNIAKKSKKANAPAAVEAPKKALPVKKSSKSPAIGLAIRGTLAAILIITAVVVVRADIINTRAEIIAKAGKMRAEKKQFLQAEELYRQALSLRPSNPNFKLWLADAMILYESRKLEQGAYQAFNPRKLREVLELMDEAKEGTIRPSVTYYRAAQAAGMLGYIAERKGERENEEFFNKAAALNYTRYRDLQEFPLSNPENFYPPAERIFFKVGQTHRMMTFHEDYRRFFHRRIPSPPTGDERLRRGHFQLGEQHLLLDLYGQQLADGNTSSQLVGELKETGKMLNVRKSAEYLLEEYNIR